MPSWWGCGRQWRVVLRGTLKNPPFALILNYNPHFWACGFHRQEIIFSTGWRLVRGVHLGKAFNEISQSAEGGWGPPGGYKSDNASESAYSEPG